MSPCSNELASKTVEMFAPVAFGRQMIPSQAVQL
jgi:hypothetical protein